MEPSTSTDRMSFYGKLQFGLLVLILTSVITATVGTISVVTLTFLGLEHVFDVTFGLQALTTGYMIHSYIESSVKGHDENHTTMGYDILDRVRSIRIDTLKGKDIISLEIDETDEHDHIESSIVYALGILIILGMTGFSAVIGYIKGLTLGGIFTAVLGGILGLSVGLILGFLLNSIIISVFLMVLPVLISIPLGMYLKTLDVLSRDILATVIITSYIWGLFTMFFAIFLLIIVDLPKNWFTIAIQNILYHGM